MNEKFSDEQMHAEFNALMTAQEVGSFGELAGTLQEFEQSTRMLYDLAREVWHNPDVYGRDHMCRIAYRHLVASADGFGDIVQAVMTHEDRDEQAALIANVFMEDERRRRGIFEAVGKADEMMLSDGESLMEFIVRVLDDNSIRYKAGVFILAHGNKLKNDMRKLLPELPQN